MNFKLRFLQSFFFVKNYAKYLTVSLLFLLSVNFSFAQVTIIPRGFAPFCDGYFDIQGKIKADSTTTD